MIMKLEREDVLITTTTFFNAANMVETTPI